MGMTGVRRSPAAALERLWRRLAGVLLFAGLAAVLTAAMAAWSVRAAPGYQTGGPLQLLLAGDRTAKMTRLEPLETNRGPIRRWEVTLARGSARLWVFPDDSLFWCENSTRSFSLRQEGFSAVRAEPLESGDPRSPALIRGNGMSALIQPPLARAPVAPNGIDYVALDADNGSVTLDGGAIEVAFSGGTADWWAYFSPDGLEGEDGTLDWIYRCTVEKFGGDNRMTLDGYYYVTPDDYVPSGAGRYYRNPAAYIPAKLAQHSGSEDALFLAAAMLDLQREHFSEAGYIPTVPMSGWLNRDYGLPAGFFDTRFNTNLGLALLALGEELALEAYRGHAMDYAAFLISHAEERAVQTENGGVLVDDYYHPESAARTHVSLNHQLAEALFLLRTGEREAMETGRRLVQGIEDTAHLWIREDGDLHYARYTDGSFGGEDYPYLTYNDLLALNRHLGGNTQLELLMEAKRGWMDANGLTDYER